MLKAISYVMKYFSDPFRLKEINDIHVTTMSNLDRMAKGTHKEEIRSKYAPLSALVGNDRFRSENRGG